MKPFEYSDREIGKKEIIYMIVSMNLGVGVLAMPRMLAHVTKGIDGIFSILIAGGFFLIASRVAATFVTKFPKQTYYEILRKIVTKPLAVPLTLFFGLNFLILVSLEVSAIGQVSRLYLFNETPTSVLSFSFMLVVMYAVSGSRIALIRLNLMYLPIIVVILILIQIFNIGFVEVENFKPILTSSWSGIFSGAKEISLIFLGYAIILIYHSLLNKPEEMPKATMIGVSIPIFLYLIIYFFAIGVFSQEVTANILFPTIEVAKEVEIPGEFVERLESIFFTIWTMAMFTTATLAFDCTMDTFGSVFKRPTRFTWVLILAPITYMLAMSLENIHGLATLGNVIAIMAIINVVILPPVLLLVGKLRGSWHHG